MCSDVRFQPVCDVPSIKTESEMFRFILHHPLYASAILTSWK